jgi:hypothetical protein
MASETLKLRKPYRQPAHDGGLNYQCEESNSIRFRHPGYSDSQNILLILPGVDHPQGGIHLGWALNACGTITGNRWDGYFTEQRDGPAVNLEHDDLLHAKDYYFHVPEAVGGKMNQNLAYHMHLQLTFLLSRTTCHFPVLRQMAIPL